MLIEFRVENHRSVRDEQALTMQAGGVNGTSDHRPRRVSGYSTRLLTVAALYGANASGKSNVLAALGFMGAAVHDSHRLWPPEDGVPRQPFAWGDKTFEPSLFEVTFLVEGVRYRYGFVAGDRRFLEEWLYAWPKGRKQTWFERDGDAFKFGEHLLGENKLVEQVTRPNALFLSVAVQHRHRQLAPIYGWFRALRTVNIAMSGRGIHVSTPEQLSRRFIKSWLAPPPQLSLFDEDGPRGGNQRFKTLLDLLKVADTGIVDLKVEDDNRDYRGPRGLPRDQPPRVLVRHRSSAGHAWLPLEEESRGTLALFRIGPMLLQALTDGGVLLVDELEASLHPLLALEILRLFNDPSRNPRNAQLLFTTHDTNLLGAVTGYAPLRRDQVWLTEKDREGATCLYPLTDYQPGKAENLERGYLQGRYGAIPFLGDLAGFEAE